MDNLPVFEGKIMETRLYDENEIKIFILYLMYHIGRPLEYGDINDIVMQDGFVGGIDFADCFADLLEKGNIQEITINDMPHYAISEYGVQIAENLQDDIASYVRTKGLKSALRLLDFKKRGAKIETSFAPRADGRFDLTCTIIDRESVVLEVKVPAENASQLELMRYHFREKPEQVYKGVLALLTGEMDYLIHE